VTEPDTKKDQKDGKEEESTGRRVVLTLAIWFAISLAAATIVAIVPNVKPCFQKGARGCWTAVANGFMVDAKDAAQWSSPGVMDWVILVVGLVVALRIKFPAKDPMLKDDTRQQSSAK
jgi:hypothetical protein